MLIFGEASTGKQRLATVVVDVVVVVDVIVAVYESGPG